MKFAFRFLLVAAMGLACVWAQKGGGTSGGTTGGTSGGTTGGSSGGTTGGTTGGATTGTTTGTPTTTTPSTPTSSSSSTSGTAPAQPIFLSGNVMMDDGSPLPGGVNVQSICNGVQRTVAHVSSNGDFGFQWGNTAGIFADASETGLTAGGSSSFSTSIATGTTGSGVRGQFGNQLANCDLRVQLAGYTSSTVNLYNHSSMDNSDVGVIVLHRIAADEGHLVSVLSLKAPKDARKSFDKGTDLMHANKLAEATTNFEKAVASYPQYADAWLSLGRIRSQLGSKEAARVALQKAMDLDDKLVGPWQELGYLSSDESKWEDAARYLDRAVRLDPLNSAMAWYFDSMANYNLGRFDLAERSVRAEMKLDPEKQNRHAEYLLGLVLIAKQDLKGGAAMLRNYIESSPQATDVDTAKMQLSKVESKLGK